MKPLLDCTLAEEISHGHSQHPAHPRPRTAEHPFHDARLKDFAARTALARKTLARLASMMGWSCARREASINWLQGRLMPATCWPKPPRSCPKRGSSVFGVGAAVPRADFADAVERLDGDRAHGLAPTDRLSANPLRALRWVRRWTEGIERHRIEGIDVVITILREPSSTASDISPRSDRRGDGGAARGPAPA